MKMIQANWPAPTHIRALTTTKQHPFQSREDEALLIASAELPNSPCWMKQVHGNHVIEATLDALHEADASFTQASNQVCAVLTADCLPILICHPRIPFVAAIHAGWRSLSKNIIGETLQHAPSPMNELLVWLGPAIGPSRFEVGEDVYLAFTSSNADQRSAFHALPNNKWLANLYQLATIQLNQLGVNAIYGGDYCTYSQPDLFYSYRRDPEQKARMASLIWINQ